MKTKPLKKLYSVWRNDEHDTLIALDAPANVCAALMGVKMSVFYTYASRPNKKWTVKRTQRKDIVENE